MLVILPLLAQAACPWQTAHTEDDVLLCGDGSTCNWGTGFADPKRGCCEGKGGRKACPKNAPLMCASPVGCASKKDHCCAGTRGCRLYGGDRVCPSGTPAATPVAPAVTTPGSTVTTNTSAEGSVTTSEASPAGAKEGGLGPPLLAIIIGSGVLLLCGIIALTTWYMRRDRTGPSEAGTAAPSIVIPSEENGDDTLKHPVPTAPVIPPTHTKRIPNAEPLVKRPAGGGVGAGVGPGGGAGPAGAGAVAGTVAGAGAGAAVVAGTKKDSPKKGPGSPRKRPNALARAGTVALPAGNAQTPARRRKKRSEQHPRTKE